MNYKIFYMTNVKNSNKTKLPGANKIRCFNNFVNLFENSLPKNRHGVEINILLDDGDELFKTGKISLLFSHTRQQAIQSLEKIKNCSDDTLIYFVEDDFLHLPTSIALLEEAIEYGNDYVTLYDNPNNYEKLEKSEVFRTKSSHWKYTKNIGKTFASTAKVIKEDFKSFEEFFEKFKYEEFSFSQNRKLVVSIPGAICKAELTNSILGENWIEPWAINMMKKEIEKSIYTSYDADAIDEMEDILHHQKGKHTDLEQLRLISEIENQSKILKACK